MGGQRVRGRHAAGRRIQALGGTCDAGAKECRGPGQVSGPAWAEWDVRPWRRSGAYSCSVRH
jgi:hypothetical protein